VANRILWKLKGPRRVIVASLLRRSQGHELVVYFEDNLKDVIETQFDPTAVDALIARGESVKQVLLRKGLVPLEDANFA